MSVAPSPEAFVRKVEIPPGAPWDQWRAAKLEAAHGAPLSAGETAISIRRLRPWAPNTTGLFGVAYVRSTGELAPEVSATIDGVAVVFRFTSPAAQRVTLRRQAVTAAFLLFAVIALGLGTQKALQARTANEALLAREEVNARRWASLGQKLQREADERRLLQKAGAEGRSFADVAADLVWLGQSKAPSVALERVTWAAGEMQVLAQGRGAPLLTPERSLTPIQRVAGLQMWRIGKSAPPVLKAGTARPSVVEDRPNQLAPSARGAP